MAPDQAPDPPAPDPLAAAVARRAPAGTPAHVRRTAPIPLAAPPGWSLTLGPPEAAPVGRPEAGLDRRTAERLRKGTRAPDARIDLHGLTAERAHRLCLRFLGEAVGHGHRVVLVITGKGRGGGGVLREALPGWLRASPLGQSIVGIYQAHRKHGGEGAFYVYLKRRR
jgi:DNA-nicking Smr family endonuclease